MDCRIGAAGSLAFANYSQQKLNNSMNIASMLNFLGGKILPIASVVLSMAAISSPAVTVVWTNEVSGDWNVATNWDLGTVPSSADVVRINVGTAYLTNDAPGITSLQLGQVSGISTLHIGANLTIANNLVGVGSSTLAATNTIIHTNGTVTVVGSTTSFIFTNGTYDISGGALKINNNRRLDVSGTLKISGDASVNVGGGTTSTPRFAALAGQTGQGIQTGGTLTAGGTVFIGNQGTGFYDLSGGTILASNNFSVGSSSTGPGNGTLTQSGGIIIVGSDIANSGQSFIGQAGPGLFNISGGTFKSRTLSVGQGSGITGTVNQTGGLIDLLSGPAGAGSMSIGVLGTGIYTISNATFNAASLNITNGTVNIRSGSTLSLTAGLILAAPATVNFAFGPAGVSSITAGGVGVVDASATINVDGSAYTGGAGSFTLFDAASFEGEPTVTLTNFALGATHLWDTNSGNFTVTVGTVVVPPEIAYSLSGGNLELAWPGYLGWYAQSNSVNLADSNYWFDIAGSESATNLNTAINPALTNVFYRLRSP